MKDKIKFISKFYGGITRDDKSKIVGVASNMEEIDIFANGDYFQAEQIFSSDTLPSSTEVYAYTAGRNDTVYTYGKETSGNKVRILSVASGGADNPGALSTLFTSSDGTNIAYEPSPIQYFLSSENADGFLYYLTNNSGTISLKRYNITTSSESTVGTLTGLDGSFDRCFMKEIFGELMVGNGKYIAKIDKDGVFTEKAFTLPSEWEAVDLIPVSDVGLIIARNVNRLVNFSKGYWWDLTSSTQFDDSFNIPMGGAQWIVNHQETVKFMCAINGVARFFQLSGAFPGAVPLELPGMSLTNIGAETSTQPISAPKTVGTKDRILYFGLFKTDKTGVYAIGKLDSDKPNALLLSKRFSTSDYSLQKPTSLLVHGSNFYASYSENGTNTAVRCETNNSPTRSSNAVYESIWIDDGNPLSNKDLKQVFITSYPLVASTSVAVSVANNYGSYTSVTRPDGTTFNTASGVMGYFDVKQAQKKVYKIKLALTSSTTSTPKITGIGMIMSSDDKPATK